FWNTWSVEGFISEGLQPAELGWGTHENWMPKNGKKHKHGSKAAIYLEQPGANTRVRSWCPTPGAQYGLLVTHNESISIADFFTVRSKKGKVQYRPTCHYAYHPCNDALLSLDEMFGAAGKPQLSLAEARKLAPYQNATGLQVTSAVLAGMVWALENPAAGIVEADEMDYRRCLEVQSPYLGPVRGYYTDWTPLDNRPGLFPEDLDKDDPWQFRNILVR
ncbi:MAG: homospermidine synthase, partial [Mesorhizobium sp.]